MSGLTVIVRNNDVNKSYQSIEKENVNEGIMKEMRDRSDGYKNHLKEKGLQKMVQKDGKRK